MTARIPQTMDELLEERDDLTRMAKAAEADGNDMLAKLYRHTASLISEAIAERAAQ